MLLRSADPFDLQRKVEVSRTLASNEHDIKYIAKRNNTERSKKILDLTDGDGVCAQEDSVRLQNSNSKKKVIKDWSITYWVVEKLRTPFHRALWKVYSWKICKKKAKESFLC